MNDFDIISTAGLGPLGAICRLDYSAAMLAGMASGADQRAEPV